MFEYELGELLKEYCKKHDITYIPEYKQWDCVLQYHSLLIGVQLKLSLNVKAITQCIKSDGVDFKIILYNTTPQQKTRDELLPICKMAKIIPVQALFDESETFLYYELDPSGYNLLHYRHRPAKRLVLPAGYFDIKMGSRSPLTISDWKIAVVKLEMLAEQRDGLVTRSDMTKLGLANPPKGFVYYDHRRENKGWKFYKSPSVAYPHIRKGLENVER